MTNKQLGMIALAGAPAMLIGLTAESMYKDLEDSWFTGVWGIIYITAWMCSLLVLERMKVAGDGFGKWLIRIMFITLTVANISNVVQIVSPHNDPWYFFYIDLFWPISHVLMLVLGISILFNKSVDSISKIVFAGAGLWLPIALTTLSVFGGTLAVVFYHGLYNAVMWGLMALIARRQPDIPESSGILKIEKRAIA